MNTLWKLPSPLTSKFFSADNKLLSLVKETKVRRHISRKIRYFDKTTFEFIGEFKMETINKKYLIRLFDLENSDTVSLSYFISNKQKVYLERFSGLQMDLSRYDYFIES